MREAEEALLPSAKAHCLHLGDFLSEPLGAVSSQLEGWREMCGTFGIRPSSEPLSGLSLDLETVLCCSGLDPSALCDIELVYMASII